MSSSSWMWVFVPLVLALGVTLVMLLVGAYAGPPREGSDATVSSRRPRLGPIAIAVAVLVVATVTVAVAASRATPRSPALRAGPTCSAPSLSGSTIDVTVADIGGMMAGQMPTWTDSQLMPGTGMAGGGMMSGTAPYGRMMSVMVSPASVASGEVSFRVWNAGTIVHELVVMPMPAGGAGTRVVGSDGQVKEDGSLGEASKSCGEGAGDGIGPGAVGWVTIRLVPGHYELMCNIAGHYAMGMYTELDVA